MDGGDWFWIILGFISLVIMIAAYINGYKNRDNPDVVQSLSMLILHYSGLPIPKGQDVSLQIFLHKLQIHYTNNKTNQIIEIPENQIHSVKSYYEWATKSGNTIARTVVGGVLAGTVGAIAGASTTKNKDIEVKLLSINYIDNNNNECELTCYGKDFRDAPVDRFIEGYNKYLK